MKSLTRILALALILAFVLSACGGGATPTAQPAAPAEPVEPAQTEAAMPAETEAP